MKRDGLITEDAPAMPAPPEPGRAFRMRPSQIATLVILMAIVGSALAGTYNEQHKTSATTIGGVDVRVKFTTRFRFQQTNIISVMLHNTTSARVDSIRVGVDTAYMSGFSEASMIPDPLYPFVTELIDLPAGEEREVKVQARGSVFGRHDGELIIALHGDTARVKLSTFVIP